MNAIDFLVSQHRSMETMLAGVIDAGDAARPRLYAEAADQLTMHISSEELVFYPAVRAAPNPSPASGLSCSSAPLLTPGSTPLVS